MQRNSPGDSTRWASSVTSRYGDILFIRVTCQSWVWCDDARGRALDFRSRSRGFDTKQYNLGGDALQLGR